MAFISKEAYVVRAEDYFRQANIIEQALCNKNYEGEIAQNETVHIISGVPGSTSTWDGTTWADGAWDAVGETEVQFTIDQKIKYLKKIPILNRATSVTNFNEFIAQDSAYQFALGIDQYLAGLHTEITSAANKYGTDASPITIGFDASLNEVSPHQALAEMYAKLGAVNARQAGCNVVIPDWFAKALYSELTGRNTQLGDVNVRSGVVQGKLELGGPVAGFAGVYCSNSVDNTAGTLYKVMGGAPAVSITFARRITVAEVVKIANSFDEGFQALQVYGGKIPFPDHMVLGTFNKGHYASGADL